VLVVASTRSYRCQKNQWEQAWVAVGSKEISEWVATVRTLGGMLLSPIRKNTTSSILCRVIISVCRGMYVDPEKGWFSDDIKGK
jgi:hypothetical protein